MCGIVGFWSFNKKIDNNHIIRKMMYLQKHRGPDDHGINYFSTDTGLNGESKYESEIDFEFESDLVLGFNRLSILDLSINGHQPMKFGQATILLNGEIYNAFELRPILEAKGHRFKSNTDTEVVLHAYIEWGFEEMVKQLNGMFAIVLWDNTKKQLFLTRDRFGIKPLYVLSEKNRIAFSSEMKSFKGLSDFGFKLDHSYFDEFILFKNLINNTLFDNITNVEPGTFIEISPKKEIIVRKFYDLNEQGGTKLSANIDILSDSLESAVRRQMISDVNVGCQLSGGVDSSLVTYFAQKHLKYERLETISILPGVVGFSEEEYIDKVVNNLALKSHKYILNSDYYINSLKNVVSQFEQPLNHPNSVGIYQLSSKAKKHVTVLLSGEGADEILGGYQRFIDAREPFWKSKTDLVRLRNNINFLGKDFLLLLKPEMRIVLGSIHTSLPAIKKLLPSFNFSRAVDRRLEIYNSLTGDDFLRQRKYEIKTYLPDLLMRQDKMSMAHSIENRVPFLDNDFVSRVLSFSEKEILYSGHRQSSPKRILKELAARLYSQDFAYRPKLGFPIPLRSFMLSEHFKQLWHDEILPQVNKFIDFDKKSLEYMYRNIKKLTPYELEMIWMATVFVIFQNEYLD